MPQLKLIANEFERLTLISDPVVSTFIPTAFFHMVWNVIYCSTSSRLLHVSSWSFCCRGVNIKRETMRYRAGLASVPIPGFMVMYNKHTLSLEDLGTLEEQNWLNDQVRKVELRCSYRNDWCFVFLSYMETSVFSFQIINMYGELIMEETQHKVKDYFFFLLPNIR